MCCDVHSCVFKPLFLAAALLTCQSRKIPGVTSRNSPPSVQVQVSPVSVNGVTASQRAPRVEKFNRIWPPPSLAPSSALFQRRVAKFPIRVKTVRTHPSCLCPQWPLMDHPYEETGLQWDRVPRNKRSKDTTKRWVWTLCVQHRFQKTETLCRRHEKFNDMQPNEIVTAQPYEPACFL